PARGRGRGAGRGARRSRCGCARVLSCEGDARDRVDVTRRLVWGGGPVLTVWPRWSVHRAVGGHSLPAAPARTHCDGGHEVGSTPARRVATPGRVRALHREKARALHRDRARQTRRRTAGESWSTRVWPV